MANKFDGYLGNTITGSKGDLGDYQHASRMFVDNYYRLSPKIKSLYSVLVRPNPEVVRKIADLVKAGAVRKGELVKVLGQGEISVAVKVSAHAFSESAVAKIAAAGFEKAVKVELKTAPAKPNSEGDAK